MPADYGNEFIRTVRERLGITNATDAQALVMATYSSSAEGLATFPVAFTAKDIGSTFTFQINAQAICVGLCYANGLSPIADKYGWRYGFIAAIMHYLLVTSVPNMHGGFCLYNGGFTAAVICVLLIPVLEKFCKTKVERKAL